MNTIDLARDTLPRIIVIDGDPGAGKTTQSELIAERFGYTNVTSGMLFCAAAAIVRLNGLEHGTEQEVTTSVLESDITHELRPGATTLMSVNGVDISDRLFSQQNKSLASWLGSMNGINAMLESRLRSLPTEGRWVFDRGLSSFPDAQLKIWLGASPYARAVRRCGQLAAQGVHRPFEQVLNEHLEREALDRRRRVLPTDVVKIDTSTLGIEEVFTFISNRIIGREDPLGIQYTIF